MTILGAIGLVFFGLYVGHACDSRKLARDGERFSREMKQLQARAAGQPFEEFAEKSRLLI